jgi:hypothetical protein
MVPPPQAPVNPFGVATVRPPGRASVKATPPRVTEPIGFPIVKLRLVFAFTGIVAAPKDVPITSTRFETALATGPAAVDPLTVPW